MKKTVILGVLVCAFLLLPVTAYAHNGEHHDESFMTQVKKRENLVPLVVSLALTAGVVAGARIYGPRQ